MKLNYLRLDVFTTERLTGNPLAVVFNSDALVDGQMQAIASEFNLSETIFIRRPQAIKHTASVRIFTPRVELPFAGHPTIGAAVALGLQLRSTAVRLEEPIGLITCVMDRIDKHRGTARFALPTYPEEVGSAPDVNRIALTLGIEPDEIGCGPYRPSLYSAGVPVYLVPVRNATVLKRIRADRRGWQDIYAVGHGMVYAFTETPEERGIRYAARMFAPLMGIDEDPATGAAAAALIGLLARHADPGNDEFILRQGEEMGRPSRITVQYRKEGDELVHAAIGGSAVVVGEGTFDVGD